jgi:activator of 2-hydroxyglutaryl-CoA dehydratase
MYGAVMSLTKRSVQLLKRIKIEPEVTLVGGILRWETLAREIKKEIGIDEVNVAADDMPQYVAALGCAILGHVRLRMIAEGRTEPAQQKVA